MKSSNFYRLTNLGLVAITGTLVACQGGGSSSTSPTPSAAIYTRFACPNTVNVSFPGVSGIRAVNGSTTDVYVTGGYVQYGANHAFLYKGPVLGGGSCNEFNFPSGPGRTVTSTSLYGPDNNGVNSVVAVGTYTTLESGPLAQQGMLYLGAADGSTVSGYKTLFPASLVTNPAESIINTLAHSTMGGVVVGNYDTNLATGKVFIYNINTQEYYSFDKPGGSASITAYGIWYNGGTSYTIAGGYSDALNNGINIGYIADWDSITQKVSNFTTLNYNGLPGSQVGTHFEGITTDGAGGYNLAADWNYLGQTTTPAFAHITRYPNGSFAPAQWTAFGYFPGSTWTSANTVYQNYILGLYQAGSPTMDYGYVAIIK